MCHGELTLKRFFVFCLIGLYTASVLCVPLWSLFTAGVLTLLVWLHCMSMQSQQTVIYYYYTKVLPQGCFTVMLLLLQFVLVGTRSSLGACSCSTCLQAIQRLAIPAQKEEFVANQQEKLWLACWNTMINHVTSMAAKEGQGCNRCLCNPWPVPCGLCRLSNEWQALGLMGVNAFYICVQWCSWLPGHTTLPTSNPPKGFCWHNIAIAAACKTTNTSEIQPDKVDKAFLCACKTSQRSTYRIGSQSNNSVALHNANPVKRDKKQ